jgi:hypothetical protein
MLSPPSTTSVAPVINALSATNARAVQSSQRAVAMPDTSSHQSTRVLRWAGTQNGSESEA